VREGRKRGIVGKAIFRSFDNEAGVTNTRVDGTRRYVSLRRDDLDARFPGLLDALLAAAAR
jgi:hypothetical protein